MDRFSPQDIDRMENEREEQEMREGRFPLRCLESSWRYSKAGKPRNNWNNRHGRMPTLEDLERKCG